MGITLHYTSSSNMLHNLISRTRILHKIDNTTKSYRNLCYKEDKNISDGSPNPHNLDHR